MGRALAGHAVTTTRPAHSKNWKEPDVTLRPRKDFEVRDNPVGDACRSITTHVADGYWHSWGDIVGSVSKATALQTKTISNLLHDMVKTGELQRRGHYGQPDLREVKLP